MLVFYILYFFCFGFSLFVLFLKCLEPIHTVAQGRKSRARSQKSRKGVVNRNRRQYAKGGTVARLLTRRVIREALKGMNEKKRNPFTFQAEKISRSITSIMSLTQMRYFEFNPMNRTLKWYTSEYERSNGTLPKNSLSRVSTINHDNINSKLTFVGDGKPLVILTDTMTNMMYDRTYQIVDHFVQSLQGSLNSDKNVSTFNICVRRVNEDGVYTLRKLLVIGMSGTIVVDSVYGDDPSDYDQYEEGGTMIDVTSVSNNLPESSDKNPHNFPLEMVPITATELLNILSHPQSNPM